MTTLPRLPDSCTTVSHESQRQLSGVSFDLDRAAVADAAGGVRESPVDDGNVDVHVEVARDDATDRDGGGSAGAASSSSSSGSCGSGGDGGDGDGAVGAGSVALEEFSQSSDDDISSFLSLVMSSHRAMVDESSGDQAASGDGDSTKEVAVRDGEACEAV